MLKKSALGWPKIAGLGIALVVAGQFSGWNFGLMAGGWINMLIATLLMALLCGGLALCVAELSTALPSAGGVFVYAQSAFGPFVGYLVGVACALALTATRSISKAKKRTIIDSVFLRHDPENLYATVVAVGEGNVVVFSYFFQQAFPILHGFVRESEDQGSLGFLRVRRIDDFLNA